MKTVIITRLLIVMILCMTFLCVAEENILGTTTFSSEDKWSIYISKDAATAGSKCKFEDGTISVISASMDKTNLSNIQIIKNLILTPGKKYKINIKIKSDKKIKLHVDYTLRGSPYTSYCSLPINVSSGEQEYTGILSINNKASECNSLKCIRICTGVSQDTHLLLSSISIEKIE